MLIYMWFNRWRNSNYDFAMYTHLADPRVCATISRHRDACKAIAEKRFIFPELGRATRFEIERKP